MDRIANYQRRTRLKKLKKRRARNIILNSLCIVASVMAIVWAGGYFWRYATHEITSDATVEQYIAPINVRVAGYIKTVNFTEHQKVKSGDTLLTLDDSEFRIKVMQACASLMEAEAAADVLGATITTTRSNIQVAGANIEETKAKLWKVEQEEKRARSLFEIEAISEQQYQQTQSDLQSTRAHYESLIKQRTSIESLAEETTKKRGSINATILQCRATLELAKLNLSYTVVVAPYDGYVGRRTLDIGQYVQAGQVITNIIRSTDKWVVANYKETQIENIFIGQKVTIKVDAISGTVFQGKVSAISDATGSKYSLIPTDNSAGNFVKIQQRIPVRIDFTGLTNSEREQLRAGMMVEVAAKIGQ